MLTGPFGQFLMVTLFVLVCITNTLGLLWSWLMTTVIAAIPTPPGEKSANECTPIILYPMYIQVGSPTLLSSFYRFHLVIFFGRITQRSPNHTYSKIPIYCEKSYGLTCTHIKGCAFHLPSHMDHLSENRPGSQNHCHWRRNELPIHLPWRPSRR